MSDSLKSKTLKGALWTGFERIANQSVGFIISVVLARLLSTSDYGLVGMLWVFLSISQLFIDSGLSTALIQKKDRTDCDFSTVFWCNLTVAAVCYTILFVAAPFIAEFYHISILCKMLRVLGLVLPLNALYTIQSTRLTALLDFKTQAKISFSSCILTGAVGITLAACGFGAWSLVGQSLFSALYCGIAYWKITGWHPRFEFSWGSFRRLFGFGSRLLASNFLHSLYCNLSPLLIGRKYSAAMLGVYARSDSLVQLPGSIFQSTFGRVIFPVLSTVQDDNEKLQKVFLKYLRIMTSVVAFAMLMLAALSKPLILTLIGPKWVACVPYIMLLALAWMIDPIVNANLTIINVKGRSDVVLKLEVLKKVIAITIVVISLQYGVIWLCVGRVVYSYIAFFLNLYACVPFVGRSISRQIKDVWVIYLSCAISACLAYCMTLLPSFVGFDMNEWCVSFVTLLLAGGVGLLAYSFLAVVLKFDVVYEVRGLLSIWRGRRT